MLIHITRISNGDVYGHQTTHCDESGCTNCEQYFSTVSAEGLTAGDVVETESDVDPDAYSVYDYQTGKELEGLPTIRLVRASLEEDTGAVCAVYDAVQAQWDYVPAGDRSRYEACGESVRTVFVQEA